MDVDIINYILRHTAGNLYWKDKEGCYLGCNLEFCKIAKLNSPEEIVGKSDRDLFLNFLGEEGIKKLVDVDQYVILNGEEKTVEELGVDKKGKKIYYLTKKIPLRNIHGNIVGLIGSSLDITERKKKEKELNQAKKKAEAANLAKTEFIANMSHDVKTPLSGVIALADILSSKLKDEENQSIAKNIYSSGQRLMGFFENCLELSQLEISASSFVEEPFNLKTLVHELAELFKPSIQEKNLFFTLDYTSNVPEEFLGSRAGLYRVMLNLIGNAIKFTHSGGVTLTVSLTEKSTEECPVIKIVLQDSGIGIAKDKQKAIFERFSRITPSYAGTYKGAGLGLYIARKFIKAMRGEIYVQSIEEEGSRFIVVLPLQTSLLKAEEYTNLSKLPSLPQQKENSFTQKKQLEAVTQANEKVAPALLPKILFVEDDRIAQIVGKTLLSPLSKQVDVADCGKKALELFAPGKYDLIFMDIGLPDIEGDLLTEKIRALEQASAHSVPVVGLTAHATAVLKEKCLLRGMQDVFSKPLSEAKAKAIIEQYAGMFA